MTPAGQAVLVLEDDPSSRFVLKEILERGGFTVLECAYYGRALEICEHHSGPIKLMIADVVLRGQGGPEEIRRLRALQPDMAVLFISGYPLEHLENRDMIDSPRTPGGHANFLQKPFTAKILLGAVQDLIGGN